MDTLEDWTQAKTGPLEGHLGDLFDLIDRGGSHRGALLE
mgnify:FL=1